MRKVSLEMNLGKKSMARFPRRVPSNLKLKLIANASEAEPLPPLGPALTLFGVNAKSFCEDFNYYSKDYDTGFPVSLNLWITSTKNYFYEFRSPSCFNLFNRCFDFLEGSEINSNKKILLLCCLNFSLIKNFPNFTMNNVPFRTLKNTIKQVLGSLRSYGFRLKKKNKIYKKFKIPSFRKRLFLLNSKFTKKNVRKN